METKRTTSGGWWEMLQRRRARHRVLSHQEPPTLWSLSRELLEYLGCLAAGAIHSAQQWKDASTDEQRAELEKTHDIRWYPFLRLPYHSPTRDNLPCAMHLFKEGLIQSHVRECLRIHIVIDLDVPLRSLSCCPMTTST